MGSFLDVKKGSEALRSKFPMTFNIYPRKIFLKTSVVVFLLSL